MNAIVPLQKEIHAKLTIDDRNMAHVKDQNIVPIVFHEFVQVSQEYPIVFVKSAMTGQFQAVCVLGIKSHSNLFVQDQKWLGNYIPLSIRNAPLCLIPESEGSDRLLIGVNETSARIGFEAGEKLFSETGEETEYLLARKKSLTDYFEKEQVSSMLTELLVAKGLLSPQTLNLNAKGESVNLGGIYIVDEDKLNALSNEDFLDLRQRGVLPSIYAHLISGQRWAQLASRNADLT